MDEVGDTVIPKIQSRGHWDVALHPGEQLGTPFSLAGLRDVLEHNTVRMRGWPVPYIDYRQPLLRGNDWIGQNIDATTVDHYEAWRFFTSAQFTQLRSVSADWREGRERTAIPRWASHAIEVWEILFYLTELVELASRLAIASTSQTFVIDTTLVGMQDRALVGGKPERELAGVYVFNESSIHVKQQVSAVQLAAGSQQLAVDMSAEVLAKFGFDAKPGVLEDYQRELLSYR